MKTELTVVSLNLQEGILIDKYNKAIAVYSHHSETVFVPTPESKCFLERYALPDNYKGYEIKIIAHISLDI